MNIGKVVSLITCISWSALTACTSEYQELIADQPDGLYGVIKTGSKVILLKLYYDKAPLTVTNFVGLASGKFKEKTNSDAFYNGLTFHRVVDDFVIQGGDPKGNGSGGPGYSFTDEFDQTLTHSSAGILSMANSGANTNGSQFFITLAETPWLDNKHSVFGQVISTLDALSSVKQGDIMEQVVILPKGKEAQSFFDNVTWSSFENSLEDAKEQARTARTASRQSIIDAIEGDSQAFTLTPNGVYLAYIKRGTGSAIEKNDEVHVNYVLRLFGQDVILDKTGDTPFSFVVGAGRVIPGWDLTVLDLNRGDSVRMIIPPELAYGERGAGGVIPPHAFLDFEVEIVR